MSMPIVAPDSVDLGRLFEPSAGQLSNPLISSARNSGSFVGKEPLGGEYSVTVFGVARRVVE